MSNLIFVSFISIFLCANNYYIDNDSSNGIFLTLFGASCTFEKLISSNFENVSFKSFNFDFLRIYIFITFLIAGKIKITNW